MRTGKELTRARVIREMLRSACSQVFDLQEVKRREDRNKISARARGEKLVLKIIHIVRFSGFMLQKR